MKLEYTLDLDPKIKTNLKKKFWQRAKFAAFFIKLIPFVRLIAVNGSLSFDNIKTNSDIDFFIITEKNRLWSVRFISIILLDLFLLRAKEGQQQAKICLNHFLTNKNLRLDRHDINYAYQYSHLSLLYQSDNSYEKFIEANSWMNKFYAPWKYSGFSGKKTKPLKYLVEGVFSGNLGDFIERKLKNIQINKISKNPYFKNSDSLSKITDEEFYFYAKISKKIKNDKLA